jgi:hypothetical protein
MVGLTIEVIAMLIAHKGDTAWQRLVGLASIAGIASAAAAVVMGLLYDKLRDDRAAICLSASATFAAFMLVLLTRVPKRSAEAVSSRIESCA